MPYGPYLAEVDAPVTERQPPGARAVAVPSQTDAGFPRNPPIDAQRLDAPRPQQLLSATGGAVLRCRENQNHQSTTSFLASPSGSRGNVMSYVGFSCPAVMAPEARDSSSSA